MSLCAIRALNTKLSSPRSKPAPSPLFFAPQSPYNTNLLVAGFDKDTGPALYWCDYLATLHHMNVCGTGYGSYFVLSLFDRLWRPELSEAEALELMKKGIEEVKARLVVAPSKYNIKVVDKDGIRLVAEV
jgi:20S proteasome subunit beta 4